jgi:phytoene dehydrogenase-like protein
MAWVAAVPYAISFIKSMIDENSAESKDDAMRRAGVAKLAAMRQGAQGLETYREGLQPQMMQAMKNQMGAYGGAQNVLSQMYGGHPVPTAHVPNGPALGAGGFSSMGGRTLINGATPPGQAMSGPQMAPAGGINALTPIMQQAPQARSPSMGFGGETPPFAGRKF